MSDQAFRLRTLMHEGARRSHASAHAAPVMLAVAGGKGGVGATTLAVNLGVALAQDGRRVLLVDADAERADVAAQCGLSDCPTIADVLSGLRSLHEAIQRGPSGLQVLPGRWRAQASVEWTSRNQESLLDGLRGLGQHTDVVLLDVGASINPVSRTFWRAVDEVLLVTSADSVAVMDAYATVKAHATEKRVLRVATIINQAADLHAAQDAHTRLQRACRRFLGVETRVLGSIPFDAAIRDTAAAQPFVVQAPRSAAADELSRIAGRALTSAARSFAPAEGTRELQTAAAMSAR
ncbi:MAG TPA: AAA family ATPase [Pirellulales bacterium]|nr:AAA family ATPase [Pirellulales bacterium]